jgi:hypothetical protein
MVKCAIMRDSLSSEARWAWYQIEPADIVPIYVRRSLAIAGWLPFTGHETALECAVRGYENRPLASATRPGRTGTVLPSPNMKENARAWIVFPPPGLSAKSPPRIGHLAYRIIQYTPTIWNGLCDGTAHSLYIGRSTMARSLSLFRLLLRCCLAISSCLCIVRAAS